ncbi:unnamed protein product, partial [Allacma fusca]
GNVSTNTSYAMAGTIVSEERMKNQVVQNAIQDSWFG